MGCISHRYLAERAVNIGQTLDLLVRVHPSLVCRGRNFQRAPKLQILKVEALNFRTSLVHFLRYNLLFVVVVVVAEDPPNIFNLNGHFFLQRYA